MAGGHALVPVRLTAHSFLVAGTGNTIGFDASSFTVNPCTINSAIGPGTAFNGTLLQQSTGVGTRQVGVFSFTNTTPMPDGLVYSCNFSISSGVSPGSYALSNIAEASDADGIDLPTQGAGGQIIVTNCTGDCSGDGKVSIGDVIRVLNIYLGRPLLNLGNPALSCPSADTDFTGGVSIGEVQQTVNRFLGGCP